LKLLLLAPDIIKNHNYYYLNWFSVLKKLSSKLIVFDCRNLESNFDLEKLNELFYQKVLENNPDIIFYVIHRNEIFPETLLKIKEKLPKTNIIIWISDDDWRHINHSRLLVLYADYFVTTYLNKSKRYQRYGHKNAILTQWACNPDEFYPMNVKKKYDVSLIGSAYHPRIEWIQYLLDNGINVKVFGKGWDKYPELKHIYGGFLNGKDFVKTINETKINLNFGWGSINDGTLQIKGRTFEFGACNSFQITNYNPVLNNYFTENKDIVYFRNNEDLLEKIKYYLNNEKERERIAQNCYENVIKNHTWEKRFNDIFKQIEIKKSCFNLNKDKNYKVDILMIGNRNNFKKETLKSIEDQFNIKEKKMIYFNEIDKNNLKNLLKADLVTFCTPNETWDPNKLEFQVYSLECDRNTVNLTDFQINEGSKIFKRWFWIDRILRYKREDLLPYFLPISAILVKKKVFLKKLNEFYDFIEKRDLTFLINILKEEWNYVELPLIEFSKFKFNKKHKKAKKFFYINSDLRRKLFFKECLKRGKIFKAFFLLMEMIEKEWIR